MVVVDRFPKMACFVACKKKFDATQVTTIFFREMYKLHFLPTSIVSNHGSHFLSHFLVSMWKFLCTSYDMSSAYHPQIDGQTEVTNQALGDLLCYLMGENNKIWDSVLCQAKFLHNHPTNWNIGFSLFRFVFGNVHCILLDLTLAPNKTWFHGHA